MITLHNVEKSFGNIKAVDGISFEVQEGQNLVLLGTSGCGKTTTLRMINRLIEATSGSIHIAGKNIKDIPPEELRRSIGYVLQHNGLFPHYTVGENIAIVPQLLKWPKQKITNRTRELLEQLHLSPEFLSLYPQQLSGGQQQRVGLARALAADPPVLLMDEPFGALDPITRENITKEFLSFEVLKGKTIVLVTHDVREAIELGDKILLMDKGKIVQAGKATDLLFHPKNKFVGDFFSSQRMQLELNAVVIKDIWPHLKSDVLPPKNAIEIDENESLWNALSALSLRNSNSLLIKKKDSAEEKFVGYDSMFTALRALKANDHG